LGIENEEDLANFLTTYYPENTFSHIIIDECHRSAWGKWSQVLTRNRDAVQIGLTATPRQLAETGQGTTTVEARQDAEITANNLAYFGEPVYEYSLAQAIEDGYLAACDIQKGRVNLDDTGVTVEDIMPRHPVDAITGLLMTREQVAEYYVKTEYEDRILLPDRVQAMCRDLFVYLLETGGPEQKTIIFCMRDRHADDVATGLNNLYARWCADHDKPRKEWYAFKCTAASSGNDQLPDLRAASRSHFIATTVDLLSTGVDVPCVRNIVFFKYLKSPISFYQMIGRGMRIDAPTGKLMFRVYDYTDATRLFGEEFVTRSSRSKPEDPDVEPPPPLPPEPTISVEGFDVHITDAGRFIVAEVDGWRCPCRWRSTRPAWPPGWCRKRRPWPISAANGLTPSCAAS
jgi:type I restriction enzyme R subunit